MIPSCLPLTDRLTAPLALRSGVLGLTLILAPPETAPPRVAPLPRAAPAQQLAMPTRAPHRLVAEDDADRAHYEAGLARVERFLDGRRARQALGTLRRLLEDHRGHAHLGQEKETLAILFARARFLDDYEAPELEQLVHARASYDRRTGRARLELHAGFLVGWEPLTDLPDDPDAHARELLLAYLDAPTPRPASGRLHGVHDLVHWLFVPVRFAGRHHVLVEGEMPRADRCTLQPRLVSGLSSPRPLETTFAFLRGDWRWLPGLVRSPPGRKGRPWSEEQPGSASFKLMYGEDYSVRAERFGDGRLRTSLNGRPHLQAEESDQGGGYVALADCPRVRRVHVEGQLDEVWFEALLAEIETAAFEDFRAARDPHADLPRWLVEAP